MFLLAPSRIGLSTTISVTWRQPPGFKTQFNSLKMSSLSGARVIASLDMTTSAHQSSTGNSSKIPCLMVTFLTPVAATLIWALSTIS